MSEMMIFIRGTGHLAQSAAFKAYFTSVTEALQRVPGFRGAAYWNCVSKPDSIILLYDYESAEAADRGLRASMAVRPLAERLVADVAPPDVMRVKVIESSGLLKGGLPEGRFLSLSIRVAEPGYGEDLSTELTDIFAGLSVIDGFKGSLVGSNDTLDEEIVGLVAWDSKAAFEASLPKGMPYEVLLFQRVL